MKITKGIIKRAQKVVAYGPEGVGKSTFASQFPDPLFMDTEDGSTHLDVARLEKPTSWAMIGQQLDWVKTNKPCKTLVIDTADWLEIIITDHVCGIYGVDSIEKAAGSYGKGFTEVAENYGRLLNKLSDIIEADIHVLLLAHSEVKRFEDPLQLGSYDRYKLKLGKKVESLTKEWADMVLFLNYEVNVVNVDGKGATKGKNKAVGNAKRVMHANHSPSFDAKNRHGLPDEMPLDFKSIEKHISSDLLDTTSKPVQEPKGQPVLETPKEDEVALKELPVENTPTIHEVPKEEVDWTGVPKALKDLMVTNKVSMAEILDVLTRVKGFFPVGTKFEAIPDDVVQGLLISGWDKLYEFVLEVRKMPF